MTISRNVITDLLPLYVSGECSEDSKALVDAYLRDHPDVRRELKTLADASTRPLPPLGETTELKALAQTRKLLRSRSYVMAAAIFFSIVPFSFLYTNGRFYWLAQEAPGSVAIYSTLAVLAWIGYVVIKRKTSDL